MFRINKSTYYRMTSQTLLRNQYEQMLLNEKAAAGKEILSPNENVVASSINQGSYRTLFEIVQYQTNIGNNKSWLQQASSSMAQISTTLSQIKERAEQMATGTYSGEQREIISSYAQQAFETLLNIANVKVDGKYIFAGTRNNNQAASLNIISETPAQVKDAKGGNGLLYGQGTYTGLYSRKIDMEVVSAPGPGQSIGDGSGGTVPLVVKYSYYDDYGRQVSGQANITGTGTGHGVDVGDGVQIYADPNTSFVAGASFSLEVGRHRGNEQALYGNLSWDSQQQYNYLLNQLFGQQGYSGLSNMVSQAAGRNNPNSTGSISVGGSSGTLQALDLEVSVGGPFQTTQGNQALLDKYEFTGIAAVPPYDPALPPSPINPIGINYSINGVAQADPIILYGTGPENAALLEPAGEGTSFYLADSCFTAANTSFVPPQKFSTYVPGSQPSATNVMPVTYSWISDPATGAREYKTINVTKTDSKIDLIPPGMGVSLNVGAGSYSNGDSWTVQEGLVDASFKNLLDLVMGWQDALSKDDKVQDYFEAVPATSNQPTSKGQFQVAGEWEELKRRGYEFHVGGPAQTSQTNLQLLQDRGYSFTVDAGYAGGAPSPTNPMLVTVDYIDAASNPQQYQISVTGTGPEHAITLQPPGEGTSFYLVNAEYEANESFSFHTDPNDLHITYTYKDDQGVRHHATEPITDMKDTIKLEPNPESNLLSFSAGSKLALGDSFNLTLEQYAQGQEYSQKLLEEITTLHSNLLKYSGDAGAKLNNIEVRLNFLGDDTLRVDDRLKALEDLDVVTASTRYATLQYMYEAGLIGVSTLFNVSLADYM